MKVKSSLSFDHFLLTNLPRSYMPLNPVSRKTAWLRVLMLSVAAFIFNTTEFVPIGLLSDIAQSFDMETAQVGIMLTIYAWVVALTSLPFMLLTGKIERRRLLIAIFVVFIASHIFSFLAWNFTVLIISRIGVAFAHAIFWSITASLALRMAPAGKKAQALSLIATGTALAMVLGLPLGRIVGQYFSWRTTFLGIGIIATLTLFCLMRLLPKLPSEHAGSLASLPLLIRRPALMSLYLLIAIVITGHYTAYSYIEPFVQNIAGLSANFATLLLLILGAAGIIGSIVFSKLGNKYASHLLSSGIGLLLICLVLLLPASTGEVPLMVLCVFWGIAVMTITLTMQVQILSMASDATDVSMSLFSGIFNIGIGAGALLGNQVSLHLSMADIGFVGAIPALAAFILSVLIFRIWTSKSEEKQTQAQVQA